LLGALALFIALRDGVLPQPSEAKPAPWPISSSAPHGFELGVATDPLARNSWKPWQSDDLRTVNAFERAVHRHADVVMFYADWEHSKFSSQQLAAIATRGSIAEITWEPWDASRGIGKAQPQYRLRHIINGRFDSYIRTWAKGLAKYGKPVRLRFAQEMNGFWYPWAETGNGNRDGEFVRAWRHVHDIFNRAGAKNVRWVWSPVSGAPRGYYPGPRYVDRLGLTCLNGGPKLFRQGWRSLGQVCGPSIRALHQMAPRRPIELSEFSTAEQGGNKAAWIRAAARFLRAHPEVKTVVWFNLRKETDWRVQSSPAAQRAAAGALGAASQR
jgi:hypothetical protein